MGRKNGTEKDGIKNVREVRNIRLGPFHVGSKVCILLQIKELPRSELIVLHIARARPQAYVLVSCLFQFKGRGVKKILDLQPALSKALLV